MNKQLIALSLGFVAIALSACRPGQKDPPMNWNYTRQDVDVKNVKVDAKSPLARLGVTELWKKTTGKFADGRRVRIGVVGSGIDYTNPDLRDALGMNPGELSESARNNGVDDDFNGYSDDVFGADFHSGDGMPYDWNGHDTYTAGLIVASGQKNPQVIGVAPNAELVVARYIGADARSGETTGLDAAEALYYVIQSGVKVVYFNWPQGGFHPLANGLVIGALKEAGKANILVVIPAGNSANMERPAFLTAAAKLSNVLIVAGVGENGLLTATTNSGASFVRLAAPAEGSTSFFPGSQLSSDLKTSSVAAAYVTGVAALVATLPGYASVDKIRDALLKATLLKSGAPSLDVLAGGALYVGAL